MFPESIFNLWTPNPKLMISGTIVAEFSGLLLKSNPEMQIDPKIRPQLMSSGGT
jgi:hypothetical protein